MASGGGAAFAEAILIKHARRSNEMGVMGRPYVHYVYRVWTLARLTHDPVLYPSVFFRICLSLQSYFSRGGRRVPISEKFRSIIIGDLPLRRHCHCSFTTFTVIVWMMLMTVSSAMLIRARLLPNDPFASRKRLLLRPDGPRYTRTDQRAKRESVLSF